MLPVMMRDKKVAHGKLRFILPSCLGGVALVAALTKMQLSRRFNQLAKPPLDETP